jgi:nitroreductase
MEAYHRDTVLNSILRRRTTIKFSRKPVASETIENILQMAMFAPSRLGQRPWEFVVIRDSEMQKRLRTSLRVRKGYGEGPVLIAVTANTSNGYQWDLDAGAATENLLIAATAHGLGSAWVANPTSEEWATTSDWLCEIIGAPEEVRLVALVALGHPAEELPPHTAEGVYDRNAVHFERVRPQIDSNRGDDSWRDAFGDAGGWNEADRAPYVTRAVT